MTRVRKLLERWQARGPLMGSRWKDRWETPWSGKTYQVARVKGRLRVGRAMGLESIV
jgi:hypothetical protein